MMNKYVFMLAFLFSSVAAHASQLKLGEPALGGTGCPAGTASVTLSPERESISIIFDQYVVEAGGDRSFDRKNCQIAIPVKVPGGYSVSVIAIDYRGFLALPRGARAMLNVNYFLAGMGEGLRTTKNFRGPLSTDYVQSHDLELEGLVWSPCGADTILRTNTSMFVQTNARFEQALATVDSVDVNASLIYHYKLRRCN
jgi:hypothetical protein